MGGGESILNYTYVTTQEHLEKALANLEVAITIEPVIACDTETYFTDSSMSPTIYGFTDPYTNSVRLIQLKGRNTQNWLIDVRVIEDLSSLKTFMNRSDIEWIIHNAKFDFKMLYANLGIRLKKVFCTSVASRVLGFATGHTFRKVAGNSLKDIVRDFLGVSLDKTEQLSNWGGQLSVSQLEYAAADTQYLFELYDLFVNTFKSEYRCWDAVQLEMEYLPVNALVELNGIKVNLDTYNKVQACAAAALPTLVRELCEYFKTNFQQVYNPDTGVVDTVPHGINFNSQPEMLTRFQKEGVELSDLKDETLKELADLYPIVQVFRNYKLLTKQLTIKYEDYVHPKTNRIHPTLDQCGAATGRLASNKPNLQQVPKMDLVIPNPTSEDEKYYDKKRDGYYINYRYCFVAEDGYRLAVSDFAGQETAIAAASSADPFMLSILNQPEFVWSEEHQKWVDNTEADIHSQVASKAFGIPADRSKEKNPAWNGTTYRQAAKSVTFSNLYGGTEHSLAATLGVDAQTAKGIIDDFFKPLPKLKHWLEAQATMAEKTKMSRFALGRLRFLGDLPHTDKGAIGRAAKNTPIQGSGSLMVKKAMIELQRILDSGVYEGGKIVLTVHDEVLMEFPIVGTPVEPIKVLASVDRYPGPLDEVNPQFHLMARIILEGMNNASRFFLQGATPDRASCSVDAYWKK